MKYLKRALYTYAIGFVSTFLVTNWLFCVNNDYNSLDEAFYLAVIWPVVVPLALLYIVCALL